MTLPGNSSKKEVEIYTFSTIEQNPQTDIGVLYTEAGTIAQDEQKYVLLSDYTTLLKSHKILVNGVEFISRNNLLTRPKFLGSDSKYFGPFAQELMKRIGFGKLLIKKSSEILNG